MLQRTVYAETPRLKRANTALFHSRLYKLARYTGYTIAVILAASLIVTACAGAYMLASNAILYAIN